MKQSLEELLQHPALWQASRGHRPRRALATGFAALDLQLHDRGWPEAATSEILTEHVGIGELRLLLPALREALRHKALLAFLAPPHLPYAPALAAAGINPQQVLVVKPQSTREWLWCADQLLRAGSCAAVISWGCHTAISDRDLRLLQQAAHAGDSWHVLFRHPREARQASPSALRLTLEPEADTVHLNILKQRGGWAGQEVSLALGNEAFAYSQETLRSQPVHFSQLPALRRRAQKKPTAVTAIG
jgi:cell division inhibitor SulA